MTRLKNLFDKIFSQFSMIALYWKYLSLEVCEFLLAEMYFVTRKIDVQSFSTNNGSDNMLLMFGLYCYISVGMNG